MKTLLWAVLLPCFGAVFGAEYLPVKGKQKVFFFFFLK